jgi:transaldolase
MSENRLQRLHAAGQSIWLDFIDRTLLENGELQRRIHDDALTGMTSNPTIFEKALAEGNAYDAQIRQDADSRTGMDLFERIATTDVRSACDIFAPVHQASGGQDGFVSIEVSPGAANDSGATIAEAKRLWATVDRPNVMVKVPGTVEGAKAVQALTAAGINVNITLLFAIEAYRRVIEAYMAGLEERIAGGKEIARIHSVASFFVSRVDTEVDKRLDALAAKSPDKAAAAQKLHGKAAIANAKLAYELFQNSISSDRWRAISGKGGTLQRPLWASTSTKNKAYRDVVYVEELIGPHTVNTMPPQTIEAFRDHGEVRRTVDSGLDDAHRTLDELASLGIAIDDVTAKLLADGIASFAKSFDTLLAGLQSKTQSLGKHLAATA